MGGGGGVLLDRFVYGCNRGYKIIILVTFVEIHGLAKKR